MKTEIHPHRPFVPENAKVLILGSFPPAPHSDPETEEWYYQSKYNQFWKILKEVYGRPLRTVEEKKELFSDKGIAIADIFLEIERVGKGNTDQHLSVIEYNDKALKKIFRDCNFQTIFFTSHFVGKEFSRMFPALQGEYLPSPSPRFARMSLQEKIAIYREKLPV